MGGGFGEQPSESDAAAVKRMKAEDVDVNKPIYQILGLFRRWFFERGKSIQHSTVRTHTRSSHGIRMVCVRYKCV